MGIQKILKKIIPERKNKLGVLQTIVINRQVFNEIPTFCRHCKKAITFHLFNADGSYTRRCDCGCRILQYHPPDKFHKLAFYTEKFISRNYYDKNYRLITELKKNNGEGKTFGNITIIKKT